MSKTIAGKEVEYQRFRGAYDTAFAELSLQIRNLQSLSSHSGPDSTAMQDAARRVEEARKAYRESRDVLAEFMIASFPENGADRAQPLVKATVAAAGSTSTGLHIDVRPQVEYLARLLWEKAGRPSGTAEADWYRAEELVLRGR